MTSYANVFTNEKPGVVPGLFVSKNQQHAMLGRIRLN
jgi:hypothetical protein